MTKELTGALDRGSPEGLRTVAQKAVKAAKDAEAREERAFLFLEARFGWMDERFERVKTHVLDKVAHLSRKIDSRADAQERSNEGGLYQSERSHLKSELEALKMATRRLEENSLADRRLLNLSIGALTGVRILFMQLI